MAVLATSEDAYAVVLNDTAATAVGGIGNYFDSNNTFPAVVGFFNVGTGEFCTGSLINARTVLTAAHCLVNDSGGSTLASTARVSFSPNGQNPAPSDRAISGAVPNPGYIKNQTGPINDIAMVSLTAPVTNIAPVTLMQPRTPIPANGTTIIMVGYGLSGTGSTGSRNDDGKRRIGFSELGAYNTDGTPQQFYQAQFRNPLSPDNPDIFGLNAMAIPTNALEAGVAPGDSGGPLFIQTAAGLVEIGEVQGGTGGNPPNGYGEVNAWTPVALFSTWLGQNNPLRTVSSNVGNFNWSNTAAWTDSFPGGPAPSVPNNTPAPASFPATLGAAFYYNVTLASAGTITTDISPTIDSVTISGAQSQLTIAPNTTLSTVVGSGMGAGSLLVNGTLSTQNLALTGGVLGGTGLVSASVGVSNTGGTVAPGTAAALGTLSIAGNYAQSGSGALSIRVAPATSDQLAVSGSATLGGNLQVLPAGSTYPTGGSYSILTAGGGVSGAFTDASATQQLTAFLASKTIYLPNSVQLNILQNVPLATAATTPLQMAVANALTQAQPLLAAQQAAIPATVTGQPTPANVLAVADANILNSPTPQAAEQALAALAGDDTGAAGASGSGGDIIGNYLTANLAATRAVGDALDDHIAMLRDNTGLEIQSAAGLRGLNFSAGSRSGGQIATTSVGDYGAQTAQAAPASPYGPSPVRLWAQGIGAWDSLRSDGTTPGISQALGGVIAGVDANPFAQWLPSFKGGMAFAYTNANLGGADESGNTDAYRLSVYGTNSFGLAFVEGRVGFGYDKMATSRLISFDGLNQTATASPDGHEVSAKLAAGYGLEYYGFHFEPSAGIAFDEVTRSSYAESGAGTIDLNVNSSTLDSLRLIVGARAQTTFDLGNGFNAVPTVRARFEEYAVGNLPTTAVAFAGAPADTFSIIGSHPGRQAAVLGTGVTIGNGGNVSLFANYNAELRSHETTQAVVGGLRVIW